MPRVTLFGFEFRSQIESMRYLQLRDMAERGEIADLAVRPRFVISTSPMTGRQRRYTASFQYRRASDDALVVEQVSPRRKKVRRWNTAFPRRIELAQSLFPDHEFIVVTV